MPRKQVFLCCECAGTDLSIKAENHKKTRKRARELKLVKKSKPGIQESVPVLHLFRLSNFSPWITFLKNGRIHPLSLEVYIYGPFIFQYPKSELTNWSSPLYYMSQAQIPNPSSFNNITGPIHSPLTRPLISKYNKQTHPAPFVLPQYTQPQNHEP